MTRRGLLLVGLIVMLTRVSPATAQPNYTEMVEMEDGVDLATDVYLPPAVGPWPVVLVRTPYGRGGFEDTGNNLRAAGVVTVAQDTRGRFASEGIDCIFRCDGEDGNDTIAWISEIPVTS